MKDVIDQYIREEKKGLGRTKQQVLNAIKGSDLGEMRCSAIRSQHYVRFASDLNVQPQTVGNYLSHLSAVVRVARSAWGYALDER